MVFMRTLLLFVYLIPTTLFASERDQLALALNQLEQLDATLQRAQQSAETAAQSRYFFDYPRIHRDVGLMREGIHRYLTPERAQPREALPLSSNYRREKTQL